MTVKTITMKINNKKADTKTETNKKVRDKKSNHKAF